MSKLKFTISLLALILTMSFTAYASDISRITGANERISYGTWYYVYQCARCGYRGVTTGGTPNHFRCPNPYGGGWTNHSWRPVGSYYR